jgi:dTDP-glucose 4,6-dehydratase
VIALVTGGFGFIGSHLCEALSRDGWCFYVIDNLEPEAVNHEFVRNLPGYIPSPGYGSDVADPWTWKHAVFTAIPVNVVFHLAAQTHVDRSLGLDPTTLAPLAADPVEALYRTNVVGTARAAEFARSVGARLVHWSTDEVYGDRADHPNLREGLRDGEAVAIRDLHRSREEDPFCPSSPYAASKMAAEAVVSSFIRLGLRATILRPSNAYGPRQTLDKLVPVAIGKLARGEPVPLYDGGYQVRQWVHAADIARAALIAAGGTDGGTSGTFNLGGPSLLRNADLVLLLAAAGGALPMPAHVDGPIVSVPDRPGHDVAYAISSRKAERELGWKPTRSIEQDAAELFAAYASAP